MVETWYTPIPRLTGRKGRKVYVYLPDACEEDPDARFPVLYMFDGHNVFFDEDATYGKSWGMKEYMDGTQTPMIIVAVDCNHRRNNGRLSEYSPFSFHDDTFGDVRGRGRLFMNWLAYSLKPMIDEHYPTIPDREATFIAGSSMGGLMTIYAVSAYNDTFSRGAALSPSVWVDTDRLSDLIYRTDFAPGTVLYMDYGSRELDNHGDMLNRYMRVAKALMKKGVWLNSRIVPNGDHCEACWEEQIPFLMQTLLYERE